MRSIARAVFGRHEAEVGRERDGDSGNETVTPCQISLPPVLRLGKIDSPVDRGVLFFEKPHQDQDLLEPRHLHLTRV